MLHLMILGVRSIFILTFFLFSCQNSLQLNKIIGSAHNLKEIRIKENQNVEKIFLSSLFKYNKNYLGMNKFKLLSNLTKKNIVVLGGISKENYKKLRLLNTSDFAGISYFE